MAKPEDYLKEVSKYTKELETLAGSEVVVGIPASKNKEHSGDEGPVTTLAEVGAIQEFGVPQNGVPQRSFLRVPLQTNIDKLFKSLDTNLKFSQTNTNQALGKLGAKGVSIVLEAFNSSGSGTWLPLKPSTKSARKKGGAGAKPLIDSGQLRQSITFEVRDN